MNIINAEMVAADFAGSNAYHLYNNFDEISTEIITIQISDVFDILIFLSYGVTAIFTDKLNMICDRLKLLLVY